MQNILDPFMAYDSPDIEESHGRRLRAKMAQLQFLFGKNLRRNDPDLRRPGTIILDGFPQLGGVRRRIGDQAIELREQCYLRDRPRADGAEFGVKHLKQARRSNSVEVGNLAGTLQLENLIQIVVVG